MALGYDWHTHTTYSDGWAWEEMAATADAMGLDGLGLTDHCPVVHDPFGRRDRYDFAETYPDRRAELNDRSDGFELEVYDGAEVNYDPRYESRIRQFLDGSGFDYTIGSVHYAGEYYIARPGETLASASGSTRRDAVDVYLDWQVALIESGLFDVVAHLDLLLRSSALGDVMREDDYRRLAAALADSRTVPELNAGRLNRQEGQTHPDPAYLDVFGEYDVSFVVSSDAHSPEQLRRRHERLSTDVDLSSLDLRERPPGLDG